MEPVNAYKRFPFGSYLHTNKDERQEVEEEGKAEVTHLLLCNVWG
jgi:hypothetical protein